jgi:poly [ADP-ribose] polymerase 7/11/12/13
MATSKPERKYMSMSDRRYDTITEGIRKSYPDSCILWVEEVSNPNLEESYQKKKAEIESNRGKPCTELLLYHGTREASIQSILTHGFNPKINTRSAYGKGSYFAKNAEYSRDYASPASDDVSFMLLCNVLVCEKNVYPPNAIIDTTKHDNSVDNIKNPSIYVTPYEEGAIVRYIVAFHKDAK